jgi:hypothetical protein
MELDLVLDFCVFIRILTVLLDQDASLQLFFTDQFVLDKNRTIFHQNFSNKMCSFEPDPHINLVIQC